MQINVMRSQWSLVMALFVLTTMMVTVWGGTNEVHRQLLTPQEVDILLSHEHNPKHPPPPLQQQHPHHPQNINETPQIQSSEAMHLSHVEENEKLREQVFEEMEHRGKDVVVVDSSARVANNNNTSAPIAKYPSTKSPNSKAGSSPKMDKETLKPDATTPVPKGGTRVPKGSKGSAPPKDTAPPVDQSTATPKVTKPPLQDPKTASTKKPKSSYAPETSAPSQTHKKTTKAPKSFKGAKQQQSMVPDGMITAVPSIANVTDQMRIGDDGVDEQPGFGVIRDTPNPTMENSGTPEPVSDSSQLQGENEDAEMKVINPPGMTFAGDVAERVIPLAAFHYDMTSTEKPTKETYDELSKITSTVFRDMFFASYPSTGDTGYHDTEIRGYTVFNPTLIQFNVTLYFDAQKTVPSEEDIQAIADAGLAQGGKYYDIYLARLKMFEYPIYSTTTSIQFISSAAELGANKAAHGSNGTSSSTESSLTSTLKKALPPIGALAGLLLLGGVVAFRHKRKNPYPTFDRDENLMKHTRDVDVESQTCASTAYRTTYFADDGEQSTTSVYQEFARKKLGQDFEKEFSKVMDELEEVSLCSRSATSRTSASVGEISHSSEESLKSRRKVIQAKTKVFENMEKSKISAKPDPTPPEEKPLATASLKGKPVVRGNTETGTVSKEKETNTSGNLVVPKKSSMKKYVPEPIPPFKKDEVDEGVQKQTKSVQVEEITLVEDKPKISEPATPMNGSLDIPKLDNSGLSKSSDLPPIHATSNVESSEPSSPVTKSDPTKSTSQETDYASDSEKPACMKQRLRAVEKKPDVPAPTSDENDSAKPEWILKFQQMGLDKKK